MSGHVHGQFCWFECASKDVAKAKTFYGEVFGWASMDVPMPGCEGASYTIFNVGGKPVGGLFDMTKMCPDPNMPSHWMTYVYVPDVDAALAKAEAAGGKACMPPMDVPGVGRMCAIADTQGAVLGYFAAQGDPSGDHTGIGAFCWAELVVPDAAAGRAFYTAVLPWTISEMQMGGPVPYVMWGAGGKSVGGMMQMDDAMKQVGVPAHWMPYVSVSDADAVAAAATRLGGKLIVPPMSIPNVGRFTIFHDPCGGAHVAAIKLGG
ncbi:MAG: putative glyoxylase CFP32 [Planctomycetes bacterium]|nr:putative glyoxylase CFP32 [Planctomycetota bacterium]